MSRQQVRGIDATAIEVLGIPGVILMENAGRCCADAIEDFWPWPEDQRQRVAIVCGSGNNGGDGYVIARHLALRGAGVVTFVICDRKTITGDAAINLSAIESLKHDIRFVSSEHIWSLGRVLGDFDLVVDAIGGTGISGALRGDVAAAVGQINSAGLPVMAVDIPTGLDCDTGEAQGAVVHAELTVTFVASKLGFDNPESAVYTGQVRVADIGIPASIVATFAG